MNHQEFRIGTCFTTGDALWRCTDVGSRTVAAIRLDHAEIAEKKDGIVVRRVIDLRQEVS